MHKVWIADDDEAIRLVLEESLSSSGFKTKTFSSGEELIKELEKNERIDKNLLRYVTIRVKKFDLKENYFGKEEVEELKKSKKKILKK